MLSFFFLKGNWHAKLAFGKAHVSVGPNARTVILFCFWKGIIIPSLVSRGLILPHACLDGIGVAAGSFFLLMN